MKNISTVNAAFAYDSDDGITYIIEVNQALDFTQSMEHSLLCPNQSRVTGIIVNDIPTFLDVTGNSTHSIRIPKSDVDLPLCLNGSISYLPVRYPSEQELEECERIVLTDGEAEWDPHCLDGLSRAVSGVLIPHDYDPQEHFLDDELLSVHLYDDLISSIQVRAMKHRRLNDITPEALAKMWRIPIQDAKRTLDATTHDAVQLNQGMLTRRYKTRVHHTRYRQLGGYLGMMASDTFKAQVVSTRGNLYSQLFCNRANFCKSYPIKAKSHAHHALNRFIHEVGVPNELLTDGAKEETLGEWGEICQRRNIYMQTTEPHSPWQNHAERMGGLVKRKVKAVMRSTSTPVRLWDYCWDYICAIVSYTASNHINLDGVTPFEKIFNYTPDVAEYMLYDWYQWIWYHDPSNPDEIQLGRWLGPSLSSGQCLASYILNERGKVITRSTVSCLSEDEKESDAVKHRQQIFTQGVDESIGNYSKGMNKHVTSDYDHERPFDSIFEDDLLDDDEIDPIEGDAKKPDVDDFMSPSDAAIAEQSDKHIGLELDLPYKGEIRKGTVVARKRKHDGSLIGTEHENPALDSRMYKVDFGDGEYADYATNVLMENLYSQVDDQGNQYDLFSGISDHIKLKDAIQTKDGFYTTSNGSRKRVITTKGWKLKFEWTTGGSSWIPLADAKESNPIEVAEYAISRGIQSEPAFAWWVPHVIKKRDRVIKQVQHRAPRRDVKFGIKVPGSVAEALQFDKENGDTLWSDAIAKETANVRIAFERLEDGEALPPGSKRIPYHFIFDVRFDLTRKARLVAGGHRNKGVPQHNRFSSVASRDSVRIGFLIAALNDLQVSTTDIGNAYLNAPAKEKVHVVLGPEIFGEEHQGKYAVIVRALYGLKSAGNAWREHFATFILDTLEFVPTTADPDVYRKPMVDANNKQYYAYLIIYVDDVLCIHHDPKQVMDVIDNNFRLKNGVDSHPKTYLGADIREWTYVRSDGTDGPCWAMGSARYVQEALRICEARMNEHNLRYSSTKRHGRNTPFSSSDYRPELDSSDLCSHDLANLFQQLIGILRWICELGRIDILHEVSILSQYLAQPRIGHLQQATNIFYYLKHHTKSWIVLDPTSFEIEWQSKKGEPSPHDRAQAMRKIYPDALDELPHNMPSPRGEPVNITIFVDADHAGNRVTRRSHTGIVIFINSAPIIWFSKRQNTVETSTFGSEFIALKIATELNDALIYKLRMFGVPIEGETRILCDNEAVVNSSSFAEATLKKKHCSIAFHRVRESVASGKTLIYYENTSSNLADLLTKVLNAAKRHPLIEGLLA